MSDRNYLELDFRGIPDLLASDRSYQANVSAISAVKDMIQRSIDLLR